MARHPDWFARLDAIYDVTRHAENLDWLGRSEIQAVFGCSQRDSIRLLHRFGAETRNDSLQLLRPALLIQLEAIRGSAAYATFLRQRQNLAGKLAAAHAENRARRFPIPTADSVLTEVPRLEDLPDTIAWRRTTVDETARFQIVYRDGSDLMSQLAQFLTAAGAHREEFFAATEPHDR